MRIITNRLKLTLQFRLLVSNLMQAWKKEKIALKENSVVFIAVGANG